MGKKSKKSTKATEPELSKKDRKRLAAEAEAIERAIAEREAKAAKKAAKKAKAAKAERPAKKKGKAKAAPTPLTAEERAALSPKGKSKAPRDETLAPEEAMRLSADDATVDAASDGNPAGIDRDRILAAAERTLADPNATQGAKSKAAKVKGDVLNGMSDAELKARVEGRNAQRNAHVAAAATVDRSDAEAVRAYNGKAAALGITPFLTSDAEREKVKTFSVDEPLATKHEREAVDATFEADNAMAIKAGIGPLDPAPPTHEVEPVETEEGTIYAAGTPAAEEPIAVPSDAPIHDFGTDHLGRYKVQRPDDGKIVGYTRTTTFIDCLDDRTNLEKWGKRMLLEGAATVEVEADDHVLVDVRAIMHRRDVAIAKAHKADRKGKLPAGALARLVDDAESTAKRALNDLAARLIDASVAHDKREKGTHLHSLVEVHDEHGIERIRAWAEATARGAFEGVGVSTEVGFLPVSPADLADLEAYHEAMVAAGLKVVESETTIVVDGLTVAGRLDSVVLHKGPDAARATRKVADVKTGRIDYSIGKIAMQMRMYADGERYDLDTHERSRLGVSKTEGVLIHLPAGTATCSIYLVDLTLGAKGIKLASEVRAWRRDGKKAIDLKKPLVSIAPAAADDSTEA